MSLTWGQAYPTVPPGGGQGFSTRYSVSLDGKVNSLGPFPFRAAAIAILNQTAGVVTVSDDRGELYVAQSNVAATFPVNDSIRLGAAVTPAQATGKVEIVIYDSTQPISSAQLSALGTEGNAATRVATLPTSGLVDGLQVLLDLNALFPGVTWLCTWNATTNFWDVIGPRIMVTNISLGSTTSSSPVPFTNAPRLVIPHAGLYTFILEGDVRVDPNGGGNTGGVMGMGRNGVFGFGNPLNIVQQLGPSAVAADVTEGADIVSFEASIAAGDFLEAFIFNGNATALVSSQFRSISATPKRISS